MVVAATDLSAGDRIYSYLKRMLEYRGTLTLIEICLCLFIVEINLIRSVRAYIEKKKQSSKYPKIETNLWWSHCYEAAHMGKLQQLSSHASILYE